MPPSQQRRELAAMGPERLEQERGRWAELKMSVEAVRTHPLLPELERIGSQAASIWQRNAMLMNMPDAGEQISRNWEQMGELYQQATEIRARMLGTRLQSTFGVDSGTDVREEVLDRLNTTFSVDDGNNGPMRTINRTLSTYARGLTADPSAVLDGSARDAHFYRRNNRTGRLSVNWPRVEEARRNIDMIAASPASQINPGQREMLQQMRAGMSQLGAIDPVGAAIAEWRSTVPTRQTDYRPVRFITAVGASLITGMGLIMGSKHGFTWPTAMWAGIAALSINPDLARSGTFNAVRRMNYLNEPRTQNLIQHAGLSGDRGAAVMEELQELRRERRGEFNALISARLPVSMAQIGQLTDGRNTPLVEAMSHLPDDNERYQFLVTMSQARSRDEQQIAREFIRGRDRVDMRLQPSPFLFGNEGQPTT